MREHQPLSDDGLRERIARRLLGMLGQHGDDLTEWLSVADAVLAEVEGDARGGGPDA